MSDLVKTKFAGIYYKEDKKTKVKTYIARIKIAGVINTEQIVGYSNDSIKTNPSIAYQKRAELINKLKNGESIRANENPSLNEFFNSYMHLKEDGQTLSKQKLTVYRCIFEKHFPQQLKMKKLKLVTKDDFQKVISTMVNKNYKPSYVETIKSCFSPIFNDAIEKGLIHKNIIKGLKFQDYDSNRYFSLSEEKAKALVEEIMNIADNQYRIMFMFLLRGRRAGEVLSLTWENINLENKTYTIQDSQSKIRKTLTFSLDEELLSHFKYLEKKESGLLFVSQNTGKAFFTFPVRLWKRIKDNTNITDMKLHDFRHLLGFTLVNNNVPLEFISKALGHAKITTTQKYSNQKELMAKQAVDVFLGIVKSNK